MGTLIKITIVFVAALASLAPSVSGASAAARLAGEHEASAADSVPVSYHFLLFCDPDLGQNSLHLEWDSGETFDLVRVTDGFCDDDPELSGPASANFDTHRGEGDGSYLGSEGARVSWSLTGLANGQEQVELLVVDASGVTVLDVSGDVPTDHIATGTTLLPAVPEVDVANVLFRVETDYYGRRVNYAATTLPSEAFFEDAFNPAPKTDVFVPVPGSKVEPALAAAMASGLPADQLDVLITLIDTIQVPRFPDLPRGVRPEDPEAAPFITEREDIVAALTLERSTATQDFLDDAGLSDVSVGSQFWLIPAFAAQASIADLELIEDLPEVAYLSLLDTLTPLAPPNQDGSDHGPPALARAHMGSDYYFNQSGTSTGQAGLIDTGVGLGLSGLPVHTLLLPAGARLNLQGDCAGQGTGGNYVPDGGPTCLTSNLPDFDRLDCWDHGLPGASLLTGNGNLGGNQRGVSAVRMDSWKSSYFPKSQIPGFVCKGSLGPAVVTSLQAGLLQFNNVFGAIVQIEEPDTGPMAMAADAAFDAGAIVLAANGNCAVDPLCAEPAGPTSPATVRSPAIAHKVLGIGVFNVLTLNTGDYQSQGPANDGRIKPDLQAPTDITAASTASQIALKDRHGGTSAATPVAMGAAVLTRGWLAKQNVFDPGHTYARMILSGDEVFGTSYSNVSGAGHIRMPACGESLFSKVEVSKFLEASVVEIEFFVNNKHKSITAAIWWPETPYAHNDIDLFLRDPNGVERAKATSQPSVWERLEFDNPDPGTWKLRIEGREFALGKFSQTVYASIYLDGCSVGGFTTDDEDILALLEPIEIPVDGPLHPFGPQLRATLEAALELVDNNAFGTIDALRSFGDTMEEGILSGQITLPAAPGLLEQARQLEQQLLSGQFPVLAVPTLSSPWLLLLGGAVCSIGLPYARKLRKSKGR